MRSIVARNVSEALYLAKQAIDIEGVEVDTRNGKALEFPTPVMTTYKVSTERVLFYPQRDANPFFHFMEGLWMLAGRNDVAWISQFNGRINTYSDNGEHFHGAYGFRWREWFTKDQLQIAIHRLQTYENDRRTVIGMWDPWEDLVYTNDGKDYPCNTQIYFWVRDNKLNMTVANRSNDMIWGAYGANAVHMSMLLEYMAAMLNFIQSTRELNKFYCTVGTYYQFSNNLHAYVDVLNKLDEMLPDYDPYLTLNDNGLNYIPPRLVNHAWCFDKELRDWFVDPSGTFYNNYLHLTATPMLRSWQKWKEKDITAALVIAATIEDRAWRKACCQWLERRM